MTNPYFTAGTFTPHTTARAASIQGAFNDVETAFDTLHTALNDWGTASSTSTLTVGTGAKSLTIEGGHFIQAGQNVVISKQSDATAYMTGQVTSYDALTGATVVDVTDTNGAGSASAWNVGLIPFGDVTRIVGYTGSQTIAQLKTAMDIAAVTDAALTAKSPIASPTFTGTPAAPSPAAGTDSTQIATTAFVQDEFEERFTHLKQAATRTLTSTTSVQKLFDVPTNGKLTLPVGYYEFEAELDISSMSGTSGSAVFHLLGAGTATMTEIIQAAVGADCTLVEVPNAAYIIMSRTQSVAMADAASNVSVSTVIRGSFRITVAGTIIPSIALTTAAAAQVLGGSAIVVRRLGVAAYGPNWS